MIFKPKTAEVACGRQALFSNAEDDVEEMCEGLIQFALPRKTRGCRGVSSVESSFPSKVVQVML